ncbi:MAG: hypothetical protein H6872_02520 [Methylobacteriaceae bacterium]|nr:hypothetical protein [Methylobacteriaceae bacterium]
MEIGYRKTSLQFAVAHLKRTGLKSAPTRLSRRHQSSGRAARQGSRFRGADLLMLAHSAGRSYRVFAQFELMIPCANFVTLPVHSLALNDRRFQDMSGSRQAEAAITDGSRLRRSETESPSAQPVCTLNQKIFTVFGFSTRCRLGKS